MSVGIAGRQVDLALRRAARALGADPDVVIERQPVVGVFQDGGEGFEESARAVPYVEVLDVVADRQALLADDLGLLG